MAWKWLCVIVGNSSLTRCRSHPSWLSQSQFFATLKTGKAALTVQHFVSFSVVKLWNEYTAMDNMSWISMIGISDMEPIIMGRRWLICLYNFLTNSYSPQLSGKAEQSTTLFWPTFSDTKQIPFLENFKSLSFFFSFLLFFI